MLRNLPLLLDLLMLKNNNIMENKVPLVLVRKTIWDIALTLIDISAPFFSRLKHTIEYWLKNTYILIRTRPILMPMTHVVRLLKTTVQLETLMQFILETPNTLMRFILETPNRDFTQVEPIQSFKLAIFWTKTIFYTGWPRTEPRFLPG